MKNDGYATFEEWEQDLAKIRKHPNNFQLIEAVKKRMSASSEDIKIKVRMYLRDAALETNPWEILKQVAKEHLDYYVVVKSDVDPWFTA